MLRGAALLCCALLLPACGESDGSVTNVLLGAGSSDATAPFPISSLRVVAVGATSVTLEWEAPGDDGAVGTAQAYDVRFSPAPPTDLAWPTLAVAAGAPTPAVAGTTQSLTIGGLTSGTVYHFALRTIDDGPNVSAMSNVAQARADVQVDVVFRADKEVVGKWEIYATDLDGTTLIRLSGVSPALSDVLAFAVSPDRTRVAFRSDRSLRPEIYVVPIRGGTIVPVSGPPPFAFGAATFAWSTASDRLLYAKDVVSSQYEVFTVRPDGTERTKVSGTHTSGVVVDSPERAPAWAADGSRVAYMAGVGFPSQNRLFTATFDGSDLDEVSSPALTSSVISFGWSPASTRLAYVAHASGSIYHVHTTLATGAAGDVTATTEAWGAINNSFAWAPDGTRLGYRVLTNSTFELWSALPDGTGAARLGGPYAPISFQQPGVVSFAWSPTSDRMAYLQNLGATQPTELFTAPAVGGGAVKVNGPLVSGGDVTAFAWAPDGMSVAYGADQISSRRELFVSPATTSAGNLKVSESQWLDVLNFAWAPDGSRLAYTGELNASGLRELYTTTPLGGQVRVNKALGPGEDVGFFRWAGSSRLIYTCFIPTRNDLYSTFSTTSIGALKISGPRVLNGTFLEFDP